MITYADNICLTKKTEARLDKIKECIRVRKGMVGTVIIALSNNGSDVFEVIPCYMFKTDLYSKIDLFVCGIAENSGAAQEMIENLISEYIDSGLDITMREYFIRRFKM